MLINDDDSRAEGKLVFDADRRPVILRPDWLMTLARVLLKTKEAIVGLLKADRIRALLDL